MGLEMHIYWHEILGHKPQHPAQWLQVYNFGKGADTKIDNALYDSLALSHSTSCQRVINKTTSEYSIRTAVAMSETLQGYY